MNLLILLLAPGLNGLLEPSQRPAKRKALNPQLKTQPARKKGKVEVQMKQVSRMTARQPALPRTNKAVKILPLERVGTVVQLPNQPTGTHLWKGPHEGNM